MGQRLPWEGSYGLHNQSTDDIRKEPRNHTFAFQHDWASKEVESIARENNVSRLLVVTDAV